MNRDNFLNLKHQKSKFLKEIKFFDKEDQELILKALDLAEKGHRGQERDGGIPYIIHPVRASIHLLEKVKIKNKDLVCAVLLHDVLEDTDIDEIKLKKLFGEKILILVQAVTRKRLENETREEKIRSKQEKIKKIAQATKEVRIIKLCDVLDNKLSQDFIPKGHPSRKKFKRWNREFRRYLPIAKKTNNNLYNIFQELV
jgi:(p)ppGpp synthase/HD superfamily hydrolase